MIRLIVSNNRVIKNDLKQLRELVIDMNDPLHCEDFIGHMVVVTDKSVRVVMEEDAFNTFLSSISTEEWSYVERERKVS